MKYAEQLLARPECRMRLSLSRSEAQVSGRRWIPVSTMALSGNTSVTWHKYNNEQ